jgi:hypothetical protein
MELLAITRDQQRAMPLRRGRFDQGISRLRMAHNSCRLASWPSSRVR